MPPRKPRPWNPEKLQLLLAVVADMAEPIPGSHRRSLVGRLTIHRDVALIYRKRHGSLLPEGSSNARLFELAQQILMEAGALERVSVGRKSNTGRRWVDPTVVITQAHIDAYYQRANAQKNRPSGS